MHTVNQRITDFAQDFIPRQVSMQLVITLETVDIDQQQAHRGVKTPGQGNRLVQFLINTTTIQNPGQSIAPSNLFQVIFGLFQAALGFDQSLHGAQLADQDL